MPCLPALGAGLSARARHAAGAQATLIESARSNPGNSIKALDAFDQGGLNAAEGLAAYLLCQPRFGLQGTKDVNLRIKGFGVNGHNAAAIPLKPGACASRRVSRA